MASYVVILAGETQRRHAEKVLSQMPNEGIVTFQKDNRTVLQNKKLWPMLQDIVRTKIAGREAYTSDHWKSVFMVALGKQTEYLLDLEGMPFPAGLSSSRLSKKEFADLITLIYQYGDENGVVWSNEREPKDGA